MSAHCRLSDGSKETACKFIDTGGFIECKFPCGESLMTELPAKYIIADGTMVRRPVTTEVMRKPAAAPKRPVTTEVVMRKPAAAPSSAAKKRKVLPGPKKSEAPAVDARPPLDGLGAEDDEDGEPWNGEEEGEEEEKA